MMATEKRLIDANEYPCQTCNVSYCYKNCEKFNAWLENTVDAVEVVHGRWLSFEEYRKKIGADTENDPDSGWIYCSECEQPSRSFNNWNYCPECGAKMDGDGRTDGND